MIEYNGKTLYTLSDHPNYCEQCHLIGGYCGHGCGGSYFNIKRAGFMLVTIDKCPYCDERKSNRQYVITDDDYKSNLKAYKSGMHECTSANTIFGGGACCDIIGHSVQPLYE